MGRHLEDIKYGSFKRAVSRKEKMSLKNIALLELQAKAQKGSNSRGD